MLARRARSVFFYTIGFGLLVRFWPDRFQMVGYCLQDHQQGPIRLDHYSKVPCQVAIWVTERAQVLWDRLRAEFPEETRRGIILSVICDPKQKSGRAVVEESRAMINLSRFFLDITHPSFEVQERFLRGILAEELHHIAYFRRHGYPDCVFEADEESDQYELERIVYYARNEHEYEALRFCARETGDRADLLELVEAYRKRGTEFP